MNTLQENANKSEDMEDSSSDEEFSTGLWRTKNFMIQLLKKSFSYFHETEAHICLIFMPHEQKYLNIFIVYKFMIKFKV